MNKLKQTLSPIQKPFKWFKNTNKRNKIFVILGMLFISFLIVRQIRSANEEPQFLTAAVERSNIVQIVSETGNINTSGQVDVYSSSNGIIEEIYVENNAAVDINQDLFKVRSSATDAEKASAFTSYQSAAASLQQAENTRRDKLATLDKVLDDIKNSEDGETFEERQDRTSAEVASDNAFDAIKSAKASLNSTWLAYQATQNTIVKAPSSGTVANLSYKIGDKASVNTSGGSTTVSTNVTPVLRIANFTDYSVKLALNEVDIPKIRVGQLATLTLDAFTGKTFSGRVVHADSMGTNTAGVVTYNIIIEITNPEASIHPGMTANVDIEVDKAENVLTVPNSAIKPYQGKKAVQIIDPQTKLAKYIPVEVGIKSPERTEIKNGVSEGTKVITGTKNSAIEATDGGPFGR